MNEATPAAPMPLRLLGAPEWRGGAAALPLQGDRPNQLLVVLATAGDWVTRDRLAMMLWPEHEATAARSNLRKVVLLVRRRLQSFAHAPALQEQPGSLRWPVATDLQAFEAAAAAGDGTAALALYGGAFCQGWDQGLAPALADWIAEHAQRLAAMRRTVALQIARQPADAATSLAWSSRLLAEDPLDDEALEAHLRQLIRLGRTTDARRAFKAYAGELARQTGLEPPATLRRLIEGADPADTSADGDAVATPAAPIGRRGELAQIRRCWAGAAPHVVQLVGPGGVGKTTLMRHALDTIAGATGTDGLVARIDLEGTTTLDQAATRVARALGMATAARVAAADALLSWLRDRPAVIGLDSAEDPGKSLAPWIEELAAACPRLRLIVASRQRLPLTGAQLITLDGLPWPDPDDPDISAFDAVQLFARHARRSQPGFDLDAEAGAVAALCAHLEGLPLALELAAGWLRQFGVAEVLAELREDLDSLAALAAPGNAGARSNLGAVLQQTWALLVPRERQALAALSPCQGGFDGEAARAIAGATLPVLSALIDKSLLRQEPGGRMAMHAVVRQFAASQSDPSSAERHATHFARRLAALHARGVRDDALLRVAGADIDNLHAMWQWAVEHRRVDLLAAAAPSFGGLVNMIGPHRIGLTMLSDAAVLMRADAAAPVAARVETFKCIAFLHYHLGEFDAAAALAAEAVSTARASGGDPLHSSISVQGVIAWAAGDLGRAERCFEEALRLATPEGDTRLRAIYTGNLGLIAQGDGRHELARERFVAALAMHRRVGNQIGEVQQLANLGSACFALGQFADALRLMGDAVTLARRIGYRADQAYLLRMMAQAQIELGQWSGARQSIDAALAALDAGAEPQQRPVVLVVKAQAALGEGQIDEAAGLIAAAASLAPGGAQLIDQCSVAAAHGDLLAAQGRPRDAALVWTFVAHHAGADAIAQREAVRNLARLRARFDDEAWRAIETEAAGLTLPQVLAAAAAGLAP